MQNSRFPLHCDRFSAKSWFRLGITVTTGTTLIEIVLSISLMTFLFLIGWAISNSFQSIKKVRSYEVAVSLATQAMEAARAARFREIGADKDGRKDTLKADFLSSNNLFDVENGEGFVPVVKVGGIEYKRDVSVIDAPSMIDGFSSELKLFRVIVKWKAQEDGAPMVFEAVSTVSNQW
ncbi:hypothetical protein HYY75_12365 [bacterium]|nr:hypothetical protein [bacterium]